MSIEENLIARSSQTDKNSILQKELDKAHELIRSYEVIIADLKLENSNNLKKFTHDLSNPLQILSMTIESIDDHPPTDMSAALDRIKRAADNMTSIIQSIRKMRAASIQSHGNAGLKVI